jgi:hypothetical protein
MAAWSPPLEESPAARSDEPEWPVVAMPPA